MKGLLAILLAISTLATAQTYTHQSRGNSTIELEFANADIIVKGHAGSTISITRNGAPQIVSDRAKGLTRVSAFPDNTGTGFYLGEKDNTVQIFRQDFGKASFTILVPEGSEITLTQYMWNDNKIVVEGIQNRLSIKSTNADVKLLHVGGPSNIEVVSGDIEVRSSALPMNLRSVSGEVNVYLPEEIAADLALKTISGLIESDFLIRNTKEVKGSTLTQVGRVRKVNHEINGGGLLLNAESISGRVNVHSGN